MALNKARFTIKPTTVKHLKSVLKKLKKKKSQGCDGITQAQLAAGAETLTKLL